MIRWFIGHPGRAAGPLHATLMLLLAAAPLAGQDPPPPPPPPDTLRVDTIPLPQPVEPDTAPEAADVRQLVRFPAMPITAAAGMAAGEWVWDRATLLREAPTSLIDLLRRIPSMPTWRGGMFVQPEAAAPFGGTAGRIEIVIDGFVLDPLAASTFDLAQLPLVQIRELRVERRLGLTRIRILTDQPEHELPYTRVEAGVAQPAANLFRGIFLVPHFGFGPLGLAVERLDTDGTGRTEPASLFSGWGKWSWTDGTRGAQIEFLRSTLRREPDSPWLVDRVRQDVVLRLRNRFTPELTGEVYAARSVVEESLPPGQTDTALWVLDRAATQAGVRAAFELPMLTASLGVRYRDAAFLPRTELHGDVDGGFGPLRVGAEASRAGWPGADPALYYGAHAEVGLAYGASVFGEVTGGRRGAPPPPLRTDTLSVPGSVVAERSGWRGGVAMQLGRRATGSLALVSLDQDRARPFGLPFDTAGEGVLAGPARGLEAYGRLVIVPGWLAVESWISDWRELAGWVYLPGRSWRTALELHTVPLPSGNLEILARVEGAQRGSALVFEPVRGEDDEPLVRPIPAQTVFNAYLQIRVIDVRMFLRWEDLTAQEIEDLPGRFVRGQRIFYGVKWNLWN